MSGASDRDDDDSLKAGHRQRLRERFLRGGPSALADYELLEVLLFMAVPRRDVKPLAKRLLQRFGSVDAIVGAEPALLTETKGVGESVVVALKIIEAVMHHAARDQVIDKNAISNWDALLRYCKVSMQHNKTEQFRILFLDRKNVLIADEIQQRGTVDHTPVYPREVVHRALDLGASALILVHNHPSGDPTPSQADVSMTREIIAAGKAIGVKVHDHLIMGRHGHTSFRSSGLLDD